MQFPLPLPPYLHKIKICIQFKIFSFIFVTRRGDKNAKERKQNLIKKLGLFSAHNIIFLFLVKKVYNSCCVILLQEKFRNRIDPYQDMLLFIRILIKILNKASGPRPTKSRFPYLCWYCCNQLTFKYPKVQFGFIYHDQMYLKRQCHKNVCEITTWYLRIKT
jgi:hypothetical protein